MDKNDIKGWIFFIFGSILYTGNQAFQWLTFANLGSEIIFSVICYAFICAGIAFTVFQGDAIWKEWLLGILAIFLIFETFNAILLIYDSFTTFTYESTDYFVLLMNANNLATIEDPLALFLTSIAFPVGLLFWTLISRNEMQWWYDVMLFAVIALLLGWLFPALNEIQIFGLW